MRQYEEMTKTVKKVKAIQCNACGKRISMHAGVPAESVVTIRHRYGYPSKRDGDVCRIDICESCFEAWVDMMTIPADRN